MLKKKKNNKNLKKKKILLLVFFWNKKLLLYKNLIKKFLYNKVFFSKKLWKVLDINLYSVNIFYSKAELELYICLFKLYGMSYKELFGFFNDSLYFEYISKKSDIK